MLIWGTYIQVVVIQLYNKVQKAFKLFLMILLMVN